jgi:hypothetical protein
LRPEISPSVTTFAMQTIFNFNSNSNLSHGWKSIIISNKSHDDLFF